MVFLANLAFNIHSGISITTTVCKSIPHGKYKNKPIEVPVSLFFHNIGPNLAQMLPQIPHPLYFFGWFPMKYFRGLN